MRRKTFFKVSLLVRNCCIVSSQLFFSLSLAFAYQYQGRSTICRCSLMRKKFKSLVFQGVLDDFARVFLLVSALISEDFPTFDLPKNANSG
jgi:hypothetical protein